MIGTNNDREYIRAIDEYISARFRIKGLFYQGNLSYRHINRNNSQLSKITLPGGTAIAFFIIALGIFGIIMYNGITFSDIIPFLIKHLFNSIETIIMSVIVMIEIMIIVILLIANFYYKATGKSQFHDELLFYLNTGGFKEKPSISEKIFRVIRGYKKFENIFKIGK